VIELHVFEDSRAQCEALATAVSAVLQATLDHQPDNTNATLAVSGGTSPRPFLQTLSYTPLDWARIRVTLVDDRWVPETNPASNARLVRETLLHNAAAPAQFLPLVDIAIPLAEQVSQLNAHAEQQRLDVAVLGMGEDGHTASLFADAPEWPHAITTSASFVVSHPSAAPHPRISLSLAALQRTAHLFLLITGPRKREVLETAAAAPQNNAISHLAHNKEIRLNVYWCAH